MNKTILITAAIVGMVSGQGETITMQPKHVQVQSEEEEMERMISIANNYQIKHGDKLVCTSGLLCIRREILDADTTDFNYRLAADSDESLKIG